MIKYEKIGSIDLADAMATGNTLTTAENKVANNQGKLWATVLGYLNSGDCPAFSISTLKGMATGDKVKDLKKVRTAIQDILKKRAKEIAKVQGVPLQLNKKGSAIAWTEEPRTKRMMDYSGSIAKVILADDWTNKEGGSYVVSDLLFKGTDEVAARCDILDCCKVKESAEDAVERLAKALTEVLDDVPKTSVGAYGTLLALMAATAKSEVWKAHN